MGMELIRLSQHLILNRNLLNGCQMKVTKACRYLEKNSTTKH